MSKFRTRLGLEAFDHRILPSAVPVDQPPAHEGGTSQRAVAPDIVQLNLAGTQSGTAYEITVTVQTVGGGTVTVGPINIAAGTTPTGVAALIAAGINAAGINGVTAVANGSTLTLTGTAIFSFDPCGTDNPTPPTIGGGQGGYAIYWQGQQL